MKWYQILALSLNPNYPLAICMVGEQENTYSALQQLFQDICFPNFMWWEFFLWKVTAILNKTFWPSNE